MASPTEKREIAASARDERGAALVEFTLVLPVLLVVLFGIIDFGKAFNYWIDSTHLANTGARFAVVNRNPASSGSLQSYIKSLADTAELKNGGTPSVPSGVKVCIAFPSGGAVGQPVEVTATSTYKWIPFLGSKLKVASLQIKGSATMRLEAAPTNYGAGCTS